MRILLITIFAVVSLFAAYPTMTITPLGGYVTSESGTSISFNVTLDSEPDDNISITPHVTDNTEAKITSWDETIYYKVSGMWDATRTVTVQGLSDGIVDGDVTYDLKFFVGTSYYQDVDDVNSISAVEIASVQLTNTDDGTSTTPDKIEVEKYSGGKIDENGEFLTYVVTFNEAPTADVTIAISSSDTTEANVSDSNLTFTSSNWSTPQVFRVYGNDDNESDGDIAVTIAIDPAISSDGNFNGFDVDDIVLTNYDNESSSSSSLVSISNVTKTPTTYTADVVLSSSPTQDVTLTFEYTFNPGFTDTFLTSNGLAVNTPASKVFTFTSANWSTPQTLEIGRTSSSVLFLPTNAVTGFGLTSASTDTNFDAIQTTIDDLYFEDSGKEPVFSVTDNTISANDDNGSFSVVLPTAPVAGDVTLSFSFLENTENSAFTGDRSLAELNSSSLTFTSSNWSTPQIVNVGMKSDDGKVTGDRPYEIMFYSMSNSDGTVYNVSSLSTLEFIEEEVNSAGFVITGSDLNTSENGSSATFYVHLLNEPATEINVTLESNNTLEGVITTPATKTLYFTKEDWNISQTVTVTGIDDSNYDSSNEYNITLTGFDDLDGAYNNQRGYVNIYNYNDEIVNVSVTLKNLALSEHNLSEVWLVGQDGNSESVQLGFDYNQTAFTGKLNSSITSVRGVFSLKLELVADGNSTYWWYNFSDGKLYENSDGSSDFKNSITIGSEEYTIDLIPNNWIGIPTDLDVYINFPSAPSALLDLNLTLLEANATASHYSLADAQLSSSGNVSVSIPSMYENIYLRYDVNTTEEFIQTGYYSSGGTVYSLKDATPIDVANIGSSITLDIPQGNLVSGTLHEYTNISELSVYPIRVDGGDLLEYDGGLVGSNQYAVRVPSGDYKFKFLIEDANSSYRDFYSSAGAVKSSSLAQSITINTDTTLDLNKTVDSGYETISYQSGWNLMSLPAKARFDMSDLHSIFGKNGDVSHLVTYNSKFDTWNYFWLDDSSYKGEFSRFSELDSTEGFWLKANSAGTINIPYSGDESSYADELKSQIVSGMNLIGFPYTQSVSNIVNLVEANGKTVKALWVYRSGSWYVYYHNINGLTSTLSSSSMIYSYEGIGLKVE